MKLFIVLDIVHTTNVRIAMTSLEEDRARQCAENTGGMLCVTDLAVIADHRASGTETGSGEERVEGHNPFMIAIFIAIGLTLMLLLASAFVPYH